MKQKARERRLAGKGWNTKLKMEKKEKEGKETQRKIYHK